MCPFSKYVGHVSQKLILCLSCNFFRIKPKQVISFLKGLLSSFHLKCKRPRFTQSLEEAKT